MDTPDFSTCYEPMDIDMSAHSNNEMDISYINTPEKVAQSTPRATPRIDAAPAQPSETTQPITTNIKKFHIKITKETNSNSKTKIKIVCAILIVCLSIMTYRVLDIQCSKDINTDELRSSLSIKLYGQSRAINSLIEALNVEESSKVLFFYGGTGVGKTYTASLILDHIGYYSNVYHYTMPSFIDIFTTDFMIGLAVCKHTTVIVDDLNANDMVDTQINELIVKSENLNKNVTIILIFNCDAKDMEAQCDETFMNKLQRNFNHIDAFKMLIKFEPLKEEHLRRCIENELGKGRLDDIEFGKIAKNFNVTLNGCKGVYTKMKVLGLS